MERRIPENLNKSIFGPLIGHKNRTPEIYIAKIEKFEQSCEKSFIDLLSRVGILATVKTDRYSLPYQEEKEVTLYGESYMNGPYEWYRVARPFIKELLDKNVYKIRFYIFIEVDETVFPMGAIKYKLRYYVH